MDGITITNVEKTYRKPPHFLLQAQSDYDLAEQWTEEQKKQDHVKARKKEEIITTLDVKLETNFSNSFLCDDCAPDDDDDDRAYPQHDFPDGPRFLRMLWYTTLPVLMSKLEHNAIQKKYWNEFIFSRRYPKIVKKSCGCQSMYIYNIRGIVPKWTKKSLIFALYKQIQIQLSIVNYWQKLSCLPGQGKGFKRALEDFQTQFKQVEEIKKQKQKE